MNNQINGLMDRIENFPFIEFIINCQLLSDVQLPSYKGSTFHGGFGWALASIGPELSQTVFKPVNECGHNLCIPYALIPPLDEKQHYAVGDRFSFTLKLFGRCTTQANDILCACFAWQQLGIGSARAQFQIMSIDSRLAEGRIRIFQYKAMALMMPVNQTLGQRLMAQTSQQAHLSSDHCQFVIEAVTPLRLQKNNRILTKAPRLQDMLWIIAHRLAGLISGYGDIEDADVHQLLPSIDTDNDVSCFSRFTSIERYSKSQQQSHKLGGLLGSWHYSSQSSDIACWLKLGELIHIGKNTSFGFGQYQALLAIGE